MRQFDSFNSYFDRAGHPLLGRARFCNPNGTPATVYDHSGTTLGTSVQTNVCGRLVQNVFLDDHDYIIYFDEWVGEGAMNPSSSDWVNIGQSYNKYRTVNVSSNSEGMQTVETMADLKTTDPDTIPGSTDEKVVGLLGYNNIGDKNIVYYRWDPSSTSTPDDGAIVQITLEGEPVATGRWLLIANSEVDVRDFGAFPNSTAMRSSSQCNRIANAKDYAYLHDLILNIGGEGYYDCTDLTLTNVNSSGGAYIICQTGHSTAIHCISNLIKASDDHSYTTPAMLGSISIHGENLKSSQDAGNTGRVTFNSKLRFDVDSSWNGGIITVPTFTNMEVYFTFGHATPMILNNCKIYSNAMLNPYTTRALTLINCEVDQSMFASTSYTYATFTNCALGTWSSIEFAMCVIGVGGTLDMKGRAVTGATTLPNGRYVNGVFNGAITANTSATWEFNNCTIGVAVSGGTVKMVNCVASNVTGAVMVILNDSNAEDVTSATVKMNNSYAEDVTIGVILIGYNSTVVSVASTGSSAAVQLYNFTYTTPQTTAVNNATTITGHCLNVIGLTGGGVLTALDDRLRFKNQIQFDDLKANNLKETVYITSQLDTEVIGGITYHLPATNAKRAHGTTEVYFCDSWTSAEGIRLKISASSYVNMIGKCLRLYWVTSGGNLVATVDQTVTVHAITT